VFHSIRFAAHHETDEWVLSFAQHDVAAPNVLSTPEAWAPEAWAPDGAASALTKRAPPTPFLPTSASAARNPGSIECPDPEARRAFTATSERTSRSRHQVEGETDR
jgi:hypothetical protein